MKIPECHLTHSRTGWLLSLSHTTLWRLHAEQLLTLAPVSWLGMRYLYRPWNWALGRVGGHHDRYVPISPADAEAISPDFFREIAETFGDELEPDGSIKKELWT